MKVNLPRKKKNKYRFLEVHTAKPQSTLQKIQPSGLSWKKLPLIQIILSKNSI